MDEMNRKSSKIIITPKPLNRFKNFVQNNTDST